MERSWTEELVESRDLQAGLVAALDYGLELSNTWLGNIQIMDWNKGHLTIAAQRGFDREFLDFFKYVRFAEGSACARALTRREQVVIKDVTGDRDFASCRDIALRAGYRAVQSTPLISASGAFVGMLSTHFANSHLPSVIELDALRQFGQELAGKIVLHRVRAGVPRNAGKLHENIGAEIIRATRYEASVLDRCAQTRDKIELSHAALRVARRVKPLSSM